MKNISNEKIVEILIKEDYLDKDSDVVKKALEKDEGCLDYLFSNDLINQDILGQALAEHFGLDYYDLNSRPADSEMVQKIPEEVAKKYNLALINEDGESAYVTTSNPEQEGLREKLAEVLPDRDIELFFSTQQDIHDTFVHFQKSLDTRFSKIFESDFEIAPEILEEIFDDALMFKASDIHFEPRSDKVIIRFRLDGVLQKAGEIPKKYYKNVLNKIKVMSDLRIDEHFIAQDGSLQYNSGERLVDVRASIVPTISGEKAVLRILSSYMSEFSLSNLGLSEEKKQILSDAAQQPFGMILVTGPTGSGKTTTLYSLLRLLDSPDTNITTIEDPVEYKMERINQIQVRKENDLTFAKGLRSIVRQDPDVILVGEIRDKETAEISVNAALTGHLLFSTFHSNDASTAIPRLIDMGIEPFLLSSTLEVLIAQRLVRRICENCRHSVEKKVSDIEREHDRLDLSSYFDNKEVTLYEGSGCETCSHTGYNGRVAVFEIIEITPEMREIILKNPSTEEVKKLAREQGFESMFSDGMAKVKEGITTIEEIKRVIPTDDVKKKK